MTPQRELCLILGTRAQLIKTAPFMRALQQHGLPFRFVYTGQHRDTIFEILDEFQLPQPDYVVVDRENEAKSLGLITSWFLLALGKLVTARRQIVPLSGGYVIIHGDTVSALWGALLGKLTRNQILHLESGLRSFDLFNPFPEEILRLIIMPLCDVYTPPGDWALGNLQSQRGEKINTHHNTLLDALRYALEHYGNTPLYEKPYAVVSFKRVENLYDKDRLAQIIDLTLRIAEKHHIVQIIHPLTRSRLKDTSLFQKIEAHPHITLQDRLSYTNFVRLLYNADFVAMDSGSSQEELSYLGVPTLLLRKATERKEGLDENIILSKYDPAIINDFIENYEAHRRPLQIPETSPSTIIVDWLARQADA